MAQQHEEHDADASVLKFLVTTDNHLGFMERDPRRAEDSFVSFEECLAYGRVEHDCDAVLLGGDLFHENKPSLSCLVRTLGLFRAYSLGDSAVRFSLLSDPKENFPTHSTGIANFQDPNMNVAMPIFMIHGNHDDPIGGTSAIDILSTAGVVNYFGHVNDLDDIVVKPVLLRKGTTNVALYGLGNVRDERLHRCFLLNKVRFVRPKEKPNEWFSILLLHQNRGTRTTNSKCGITEEMLKGFNFDLVIWGNEHEQQLTPQPVTGGGFDVVQPGSTIMTSLTGNESNPKQCGILEIKSTSYRLTPYTLRTVRPVVRRQVELHREQDRVAKSIDAVEEHLKQVAESLLDEAEDQIRRIPDSVLRRHPHLKFPLMRIACDFHDPMGGAPFPQPNHNRFGQRFLDVVVNPNDVLKAIKPPAGPRAITSVVGVDGQLHFDPGTAAQQGSSANANAITTTDIRTKIAEVFSASAKDACHLLSEPEVSHAVYTFVEKSEKHAIEEKINELLHQTQRGMWKNVRDRAASGGGGNAASVVISPTQTDLTVKTLQEMAVTLKAEVNRKFRAAHNEDDADDGEDGSAAANKRNNHKGDEEQQDTGKFLENLRKRSAAVEAGGLPLGAPLPVNVVDDDDDDDDMPRVDGVLADLAQAQEAAASSSPATASQPKSKRAPAKKAAGKKRGRAAAAAADDDENDDNGQDDESVLLPAPPKKRSAAPRGKKAASAAPDAAAAPQLALKPSTTAAATSKLIGNWAAAASSSKQ